MMNRMDNNIQLITVSQTANLLAVHRSTIYRLLRTDDDFPKIYEFCFGKRFNKHDVIQYINTRKAS